MKDVYKKLSNPLSLSANKIMVSLARKWIIFEYLKLGGHNKLIENEIIKGIIFEMLNLAVIIIQNLEGVV